MGVDVPSNAAPDSGLDSAWGVAAAVSGGSDGASPGRGIGVGTVRADDGTMPGWAGRRAGGSWTVARAVEALGKVDANITAGCAWGCWPGGGLWLCAAANGADDAEGSTSASPAAGTCETSPAVPLTADKDAGTDGSFGSGTGLGEEGSRWVGTNVTDGRSEDPDGTTARLSAGAGRSCGVGTNGGAGWSCGVRRDGSRGARLAGSCVGIDGLCVGRDGSRVGAYGTCGVSTDGSCGICCG